MRLKPLFLCFAKGIAAILTTNFIPFRSGVSNQLKSYRFITNTLRFKTEVDGALFLCYSHNCNMRDITDDAFIIAKEGFD